MRPEVSPEWRRRAVRKLTAAMPLFAALIIFAQLPSRSWADAVISIPGNAVQVTGTVPLRAMVSSNNSTAITNIQVLDGSTQIGNYGGNGTPSIDIRGVFTLSTGSHTLTINGTDTGNNVYTASTTFTVAANGSVTQSPAPDSQNPSPVSWQATCTANTSQAITAMKLYLDFNPAEIASYTGSQNTLTESASWDSTVIPAGSHSLTTNCWDGTGQVYQSSIDFTVGTAFPGAPGTAVSLNLDNPASGWHDCAGCSGTAGGDAAHTDVWPALSPAWPSIDNDSRGFSITTSTGGTFQGFLWFTNFSNSGTQFASGFPVNWIYDYYVNVSNPLVPDYALEFDGNQTAGAPSGKGWTMGTECNYGANPLSGHPIVWRFWDVSAWNNTYNAGGALSCPLQSYGHWYRVQMYFTLNTSAFNYTLRNVRVTDTTTNSVVQDSTAAFTFGGTLTTGHGNGIDIQEDGNNNHTYPVTYDKINVIRW